MSTYYEFYAVVEKDGKIEGIDLYVCKNGEYSLTPIMSRSRFGIQWDDFGCLELPIEKMTEEHAEFFTSIGWGSTEIILCSGYHEMDEATPSLTEQKL